MPREFISVTAADNSSAFKLGDETVVDNDNDVLPTVWKPGPSNTEDTTDPDLLIQSNVWHPGLVCVPPSEIVISADVSSGEFPLSVEFSAEIPDNVTTPVTYLWDFGDGNTSTEAAPTHVFETEDDFNVTLTVSNECGEADSNTLVIEVSDPNVLFDDTFTGTVGTNLSAHTPDIAPSGFVWRRPTGSNLLLTGDGHTESENNSDGFADSNNSSPAFTLPLAYPYNIRLIATIPAVPAAVSEGAIVQLYEGVLYITFGINSGTGFRNIYFTNFSGQTLFHALPGPGEYNVMLKVVDASNIEMYLDDVLVASRTVGFGIVAPDILLIQASAEPGAKYKINRLTIDLD